MPTLEQDEIRAQRWELKRRLDKVNNDLRMAQQEVEQMEAEGTQDVSRYLRAKERVRLLQKLVQRIQAWLGELKRNRGEVNKRESETMDWAFVMAARQMLPVETVDALWVRAAAVYNEKRGSAPCVGRGTTGGTDGQ